MVMIVFTDVAAPAATQAPGERPGRSRPQRPAGGTGAGTPAGPRGAADHPRRDADLAGGTPVHQRGAAVHQRGTAVHQRGADHLQGGDAVAERGAADGQHRAAGQGGRAVAGQQRHEEPAQQHGHRHPVPGQRPQRAALHHRRRRKSSSSSPATWAGPSPTSPPTCSTRNWPTTRARCCGRWSSRKSRSTPRDGRWFTVRIMPYRTLDDRIDGVVITFAGHHRGQDAGGASCGQTRSDDGKAAQK